MIVLPTISKHITRHHIDEMGRWAGITLKMQTSSVKTILSMYQPPKEQITESTINVTAQQTRQLTNKGVNLNIFQQYQQDIGKVITGLQQQNHEIIVGGDFNERNETNNVIKDIEKRHQLVEIMVLKHSETLSTYLRGTNALDQIFLSPTLITSNTMVNLGDPNSVIETDHIPIRLQIVKNITNPTEYQTRNLASNHAHKVIKYIQ
jgi:endonuclease/exonuclease/phosphatase (EEP) superfamily protein YafD